ncbi:MAG: GNAT family N-acetyltransferase [Caldilineaceae bacterium]
MSVPRIETARLILRGFTPADEASLHAIVSQREVLRYFPRTEPWPLANVQKWIASQPEHWEMHGFGWYAVEQRATQQLMGWCGLRVLEDTGEIEVLYLFDKPFWGQGYATEAARACVEEGFRRYGLKLIIGLTLLGNIASQRVLEKAGLRFLDQTPYFGVECRRYIIDQERFTEFYGNLHD